MGRKKGKQCGSFQRKSMNAAHTLEWQTRAYEEAGGDKDRSSNRGYAASHSSNSSNAALDRPLSASRSAVHVSRPIVRTSHLKNLLVDRQVDDRLEYQRFRQRLFQVTTQTRSTVNSSTNKKTDNLSTRNKTGWLVRHVNERERIKREVLEEDYQNKSQQLHHNVTFRDVEYENHTNFSDINHDHYQYGDVHHHHRFIYPRKKTIIKKSESTSSLYEDDSISIEDNDHDDGVMTNEDPLQQQQLQSVPSLVTLCIKTLAQPGVMQTYVLDCGYDIVHSICQTFSSSLLASLSTEMASNVTILSTNVKSLSMANDAVIEKEDGMIDVSATGRQTKSRSTTATATKTNNHLSLSPPWMGALMNHSHLERFVLAGPTNHDCDQHHIMANEEGQECSTNEKKNDSKEEEESFIPSMTCRYCHDINYLFGYLSSSSKTENTIEQDVHHYHKQNNNIIMNHFTARTDGVVTATASVDVEDWEDRFSSDDDEDEDSIIMYHQHQQHQHPTTYNDHLSFTTLTNHQPQRLQNLLRLEVLDVPYLDPILLKGFLQVCAPNMTHLRFSNVFHSSTGPQFLLQCLIQGSQRKHDDWITATSTEQSQTNDSFDDNEDDGDRQSFVLLPQLEIFDLSHNTWLTTDLLQEFLSLWMEAFATTKKQNHLERINVHGCGCCTEGLDVTINASSSTALGWFAANSSNFFKNSTTNNGCTSIHSSTIEFNGKGRGSTIWIDTQHHVSE